MTAPTTFPGSNPFLFPVILPACSQTGTQRRPVVLNPLSTLTSKPLLKSIPPPPPILTLFPEETTCPRIPSPPLCLRTIPPLFSSSNVHRPPPSDSSSTIHMLAFSQSSKLVAAASPNLIKPMFSFSNIKFLTAPTNLRTPPFSLSPISTSSLILILRTSTSALASRTACLWLKTSCCIFSISAALATASSTALLILSSLLTSSSSNPSSLPFPTIWITPMTFRLGSLTASTACG
mmetsp:Transcript_4822/g.9678  ORF Transcript_4822/g.9678 Transcript_4822/m.9678 type:complete len:235 (-) Transcript_4822:332-1036(-)